MNIFYLHEDPRESAMMLCDKHVVKMILESAQMLSTAHRVLDGDEAPQELYREAYKNHPSTKWVRSSMLAYAWAYNNWFWMCCEYRHRYQKVHASFRLNDLLDRFPKNISKDSFVPPPLCMPDEFKLVDDSVRDREIATVLSYRKYYNSKPFKMVYTMRERPEWLPIREIDESAKKVLTS
jgi:hypothetical protein